MRDQPGPHVITVGGVTGSVTKAYLYWHGPTNTSDPTANANIFLNAVGVLGTNIGFSDNNCWGFANSQAYRADVTALVPGNGTYSITGAGSGSPVNSNGASLVVFFNDGNSTNNRDVVMFDGNDSNINNPFDAPGWNVSLPGINYTSGTASMQMHVADGQTFPDDALVLNSTVLVPTGNIFQGDSVPGVNNGPSNNGRLWDIKNFDVTSFLSPGPNTLTLTTGVNSDCLALVLAIVDLPAGAAPGQLITLMLDDVGMCTLVAQPLTATLVDTDGNPVTGVDVTFEVISGPHTGVIATVATDSSGVAAASYVGAGAGTDAIQACFVDNNGVKQCATASKVWTVCNLPPITSNATPSLSCIWPPNHKFVGIDILGVTDPDGDPLMITVTGVTSDEPTATMLGAGGGGHAPDAMGVGSSTAQVRGERSGTSDGRVYSIQFLADDGKGGQAAGAVQVQVPRDIRRNTCAAVDSGQLYDATN